MSIKTIIIAAVLLASPFAAMASNENVQLVKQIYPLATPVPKFERIDCRFMPCHCHNECIRWDNKNNCLQTYRTCDTCSICKED
jgi:hypothetical protein